MFFFCKFFFYFCYKISKTNTAANNQKTTRSLILEPYEERFKKFNNILLNLTRKEKTKLKNDFKALTIRYKPKINHLEYLQISNNITAYFNKRFKTAYNSGVNDLHIYLKS